MVAVLGLTAVVTQSQLRAMTCYINKSTTISTGVMDEENQSRDEKKFSNSLLIRAMIQVESNNKPDAKSPAGAAGLMQLMPETGKWLHGKYKLGGNYDPYNPEQNVEIGSRYIKDLIKKYSYDVPLALAAYNFGPGNVDKLLKNTGGVKFEDISDSLPSETREYPKKIWEALNQLKQEQEDEKMLASSESKASLTSKVPGGM